MTTAFRYTQMFIAGCLAVGLAACQDPAAPAPAAQSQTQIPYSETRPVEAITLAMKTVAHLARDNWQLAAAAFDPAADEPIDAAALEAFWTGLESKHGDYVKIGDSQGARGEDHDTVQLTVEFEADAVEMVFEIQDEKITKFAAPGLK